MKLRVCDKCQDYLPSAYFEVQIYPANNKARYTPQVYELCQKCRKGLKL